MQSHIQCIHVARDHYMISSHDDARATASDLHLSSALQETEVAESVLVINLENVKQYCSPSYTFVRRNTYVLSYSNMLEISPHSPSIHLSIDECCTALNI